MVCRALLTFLSSVDYICSKNKFSTLCDLLGDTDLVDTFNGEYEYTIFAPTDNAFDNVGDEIVNLVTKKASTLRNLLLFHAVDDKVKFDDLYCTGLTEMANGDDSRTVCTSDGKVHQKGGGNPRNMMPRIIEYNIPTCQGYIHVIDEVLLPRQLTKEANVPSIPTPEPPMRECYSLCK